MYHPITKIKFYNIQRKHVFIFEIYCMVYEYESMMYIIIL
jgi:hypothetical protein